MNLFMNITIDFRFLKTNKQQQKKNFCLYSDVDTTQVAFNSMFIGGQKWDFSLPVKNTRMEWEIMSTLDLVNLANQLTCTLDESPKRKTAKILNIQLQQIKPLK